MLILSRMLHEEIIVRGSGETRIRVIEIRNHKVRLSFEADREIEIDRAEVREKKDRDSGEQD